MERPDWASLHSVVDDLKRAIGSLDETQKRIARITGTGYSPDRMVKVVVGPRGQLVDIEIDPRVFRNPDSRGLADAILVAARNAVNDANGKTTTIVNEAVPVHLRRGMFAGEDQLEGVITRHDGDLNEDEGSSRR
ncbi:YbaB/EbfC family nucleoid-associated protein [Dactylosporangium darangshiense]|jgi:DNA-binding protein YbaB|uniref:YbaB/EbfC family DNA-binding protein n=1 Tax=Dactylosporangium darangshiense TaxID=579108 RepID=A0ABP8DCN1_9ACTN|nr:YbaB/EbfC family nucleoid-associated protein [Dactylosporangium sp.]